MQKTNAGRAEPMKPTKTNAGRAGGTNAGRAEPMQPMQTNAANQFGPIGSPNTGWLMAVWQTGARLPDWLDWENESGTNLAGGQSGKLSLAS